jgi:hypothetical protein
MSSPVLGLPMSAFGQKRTFAILIEDMKIPRCGRDTATSGRQACRIRAIGFLATAATCIRALPVKKSGQTRFLL